MRLPTVCLIAPCEINSHSLGRRTGAALSLTSKLQRLIIAKMARNYQSGQAVLLYYQRSCGRKMVPGFGPCGASKWLSRVSTVG
jgi:hypothetical protein